MSLLNIILILAYLIWSYRVVFKLNWNDYKRTTERAIWLVITSSIFLFIAIVIMLFIKENGYLNFLTKPLW